MMSDFFFGGGLGGSSKMGQNLTRVGGSLAKIGRPKFQKYIGSKSDIIK